MRARECSTREAWIFARNFRSRFLRLCDIFIRPCAFSVKNRTRREYETTRKNSNSSRLRAEGREIKFRAFLHQLYYIGSAKMHTVLSAECRDALGRVAIFSSPSNQAPVFGLRFFNLPSLSTRGTL